MKRKKIILFSLLAVLASAILYCLISYAIFINNISYFPSGTKINDIDCSHCTSEEAIKKLKNEWNKKTLNIFNASNNIIGTIDNFQLEYDIKEDVDHLLKPNMYNYYKYYVIRDRNDFKVDMNSDKCSESILKQLRTLDCLKQEKGEYIPPKNAYVDMTNFEFNIVKEKQGTKISRVLFKDSVMEHIKSGNFHLNFIEEKYYLKPTILSTDKRLKEKQDYCEKYLSNKIIYELGSDTKIIEPKDLDKMIKVGDNNKITVSNKEVTTYVYNLAEQIDTQGKTRTISSPGSGTFTVYGGDFGYSVYKEKEIYQLTRDILSQSDITRKPIYSHRAFIPIDLDISDSYVDISLSRQRLWLIKDGYVIFSSPIVTGNVKMGYSTPQGTYGLTYKQKDATLRGENADGTKYESDVKYWMPFNRSIGMHDAPWRSEFGKDIYKEHGSHGCINMPPDNARRLYPYVSPGFPIIVHY